MYTGRGTKLYGFCNGYFGRNSYDTKIIREIGVIGDDLYIVAENERSKPVFAVGMTFEDVERWASEQERLHWSGDV